MTRHSKIQRRAFIRGVGAGLLAAPFMSPSRVWAAGEVPRRLICIVHPNGPVPQMFWPNGGPGKFGAISTMNTTTQSLEAFKNKMLFIGNVDHKKHMDAATNNPNAHTASWLVGLTGAYPSGDGTGFASGPSIDHAVSSAIVKSAGTPRQSLHLWTAGKNDVRAPNSRISYRAANAPNDPYLSPYAAFDALFKNVGASAPVQTTTPGSTTTTTSSADLKQRRKCQIIDRIRSELLALKARLGQEDAQRLEQHVASIHELEGQLRCAATTDNVSDPQISMPAHITPTTCARPSLATGIVPTSAKNYAAVSKMHIDIMVTAMACDITRVGTLQYSAASGTGDLPVSLGSDGKAVIGTGSGHHNMSHVFGSTETGSGTNGEPPAFVAISQWYYEQMAYLLNKLDSTPEPFGGGGTMLDHTLVFSYEDLGGGFKHNHQNLAYMLAGMGDKINVGQYINSNGASPCQVLVSIANAFGLNVNSFGYAGAGHTGEVTGVRK